MSRHRIALGWLVVLSLAAMVIPASMLHAQSLGARLIQSRSDYVLLSSPIGFAFDVATPSRGPLSFRISYLARRDVQERFDSTYEFGIRTIEVGPLLTVPLADALDARFGLSVAWNHLDSGDAADQPVQPVVPESPGAGWSAAAGFRWRPFSRPMWGVVAEGRIEDARLGGGCGVDAWFPFCEESRFASGAIGIELDLGSR